MPSTISAVHPQELRFCQAGLTVLLSVPGLALAITNIPKAAALLIRRGLGARVLAGGMDGWLAGCGDPSEAVQ